MKPKTKKQVEAQVREWNARYPIGTLVKRYRLMHPLRDLDSEYRTRTIATDGFGVGVVWLEGFSGSVALDSIEPVRGSA